MEAAHRWGFDPNQPGVKHLLRARALEEVEEVEVEMTKGMLVTRWCAPGERVTLPKPYAEGLIERGFASRFATPS